MRRRTAIPDARLASAAVGASILALPATAAAVGDAASTGAGDAPPIQAKVQSGAIRFGHDVVVTGQAPALTGHTLRLEFASPGSTAWRQVAASRVSANGGFRLSAALKRSGAVKVTDTTPQMTGAPASPLAQAAAATPGPATRPQRVSVAAAIHVASRRVDVLGEGAVHVRGRLLPGAAGRRVVLQLRRGGRWVTVARARTGGRGGFDLRYRAGTPGREGARIRFAGDRHNAASATGAGEVTVYAQSTASWYDDAGTTGCGFHAYYGVANMSLPCGTRVRLAYGGRKVTATVDDRGPYVAGRAWDLNQNTAAALGFGGVAPVWSSS
jgi:rare lipoprotein A